MSTKRFILMLVCMNLIIGILVDINQNPLVFTDAQITVETLLLEEAQYNFQTEEGKWGQVKSTYYQGKALIGNGVVWSAQIVGILLRGLNPFSFSVNDFVSPIEQVFATVIIFFRTLLMTIAIIEAFMLIFGRKTD